MPIDDTPPVARPAASAPPGEPTSAIENAITALTRFWSDSQLYPEGHPLVAGQLAEAAETLARMAEQHGEVTIKNIDGDLVSTGQRLFARATAPGAFIGALSRRGIGYVAFQRGITADDLKGLCAVLSVDAEDVEGAGDLVTMLSEAGARHVEIGALGVLQGAAGPAVGDGGGGFVGASLVELYQSAMDVAREAMQSVRNNGQIDVPASTTIIDELVSRVTQDSSAAIGLACLKGHDEYTFSHCVHTALLSMALGEAIGLEADELRELGMATMLHDVGKVLIPLEILRKPTKLTEDEWEAIRRHPADGAAILLEYPDLPVMAPLVAFEHHIHCDMTGYPEVSGTRDLALFSMMLSLADVYDALTTYRPYRPALRPEEAAAEMRSMPEGKFQPRLAEWFRQMLGIYPPGTCVELDSGECAVVCRSDPGNEMRPMVCVVADQNGDPIASPYEVSLSETAIGGSFRRSIAGAIDPVERGIDGVSALDAWLRRRYAKQNTSA
jgi:HD-GYP domain-containing protein (c-di-GMP phosphodiesterase class II)